MLVGRFLHATAGKLPFACLGCGLLFTPARADSLLFAPPLQLSVGQSPSSAAPADFNADGRLDLAVVNFDSDTVSVLLGARGGAFGTKTDFGTGHNPLSVATGDFNLDGHADLATANVSSGNVSVLLGKGDGTFAARKDFAAGVNPYAVAAADFDVDGRPDLAVVDHATSSVSVLRGNGDGTLGVKTDFAVGAGPVAQALGDFNADGKIDLAVVDNSSSAVSILLGSGGGGFAPKMDLSTGTNPSAAAVADFNADGRLDLAVANAGAGSASIFLGNGNGTFGVRSDLSTGPHPMSIAIADFNLDGRPDLAVANNSVAGVVSILLGTYGAGFEARSQLGAGSYPVFVTAADFNADGLADLGTVNSVSNSVSILLAKGTFASRVNYAVGRRPVSLAAADLDSDGHLDLVTGNIDTGTVSLLPGQGDGTFASRTDLATGFDSNQVAIGDFNQDGRPDLAVAACSLNAVCVLLGKGDGTFEPKTEVPASYIPFGVAIGDLDRDGRLDLAVLNQPDYPKAGSISVFQGKGDGTFVSKGAVYTARNPISVVIADLDSDSIPDLAVAVRDGDDSGKLGLLFGKGDGTFRSAVEYPTGRVPVSLAIGDLNDDHLPDLVTIESVDNAIAIFLGIGNGVLSRQPDLTAPIDPWGLTIADFDRDRRMDLGVTSLAAPMASYTVSVYSGKGDGTFQPRRDFYTGDRPVAVIAADLNHDRFPDLVTANWGSISVSVLLYHGPSPVTMRFELTPGTLVLSSPGRWLTGFLQPVAPYSAADIDVASIRLNDIAPVDPSAPVLLGDRNGDGIADLTVKFDKIALSSILSEGESVPIEATGTIEDRWFSGRDAVRVRRGSAGRGHGLP
jgi:hypothetical protein